MNRKTLRQNMCDECGNSRAEVLIIEERRSTSEETYPRMTREIVCYTCSDCASEYVEKGYKEIPVFDVDPDVVEVEQLTPESKRFTIKKRDTSEDAWMRMQGDDMIEDVESRR